MPSGYTAAIADGITFKDFLMSCARAFGATITMRDDPADAPIPDEFQPSEWNKEQLEKAKANLAEIEALTDEQCAARLEKEKADSREYHAAELAKDSGLRQKYDTMLAQVQAWTPPSPEHEGIKKFMVDQIQDSIRFDCGSTYHQDAMEALERLTPEAWRAKQIEDAKWSIDYHAKQWDEEVARVAQRNRWIRQLRESINGATS